MSMSTSNYDPAVWVLLLLHNCWSPIEVSQKRKVLILQRKRDQVVLDHVMQLSSFIVTPTFSMQKCRGKFFSSLETVTELFRQDMKREEGKVIISTVRSLYHPIFWSAQQQLFQKLGLSLFQIHPKCDWVLAAASIPKPFLRAMTCIWTVKSEPIREPTKSSGATMFVVFSHIFWQFQYCINFYISSLKLIFKVLQRFQNLPKTTSI